MTVKYDENEEGIFWVDGDQKGKPQKDLRHAMDDYQLTVAGRNQQDEGGSATSSGGSEGVRVHTGDDGGATPSGGGTDDEDDEEADGR